MTSGGLRNSALVGLVSILLFLPSALFAVALQPAPGALILVGCALALGLILRGLRGADFLDASLDGRALALCVALACALLVLGGALHFFYAPLDWRIRDAVLADLARDGLRVVYRDKGLDYVLRAPLAMYVLPSLVGRLAGLLAAHVALLAQNAVFLGALFYVLLKLGRGWLQLAIVIFYGGLSLIGFLIIQALSGAARTEFVLKYGLDAWSPYFQFTGSASQFIWAPNHALPGWWLACLVILRLRRQVDSAMVAATIGGAIFWSPLVVIPVACWLVYLAARDWRGHFLNVRVWLAVASGLCFTPLALFLVAGFGSIAQGVTAEKPLFALVYCLFMAVQMGPMAYVLANRAHLDKAEWQLFGLSAAALFALPMIHFGPSNDLVMRGSIAPLTIAAFLFGGMVARLAPTRSGVFALGCVLAALSSASAWFDLSRAFRQPRYDISDCTLFEANDALGGRGAPTNYVVTIEQMPAWLMQTSDATPVSRRARRCWSDIDDRSE